MTYVQNVIVPIEHYVEKIKEHEEKRLSFNERMANIMNHNKFQKWYDNQNDTTKAWLDAQSKNDLQLIFSSMLFGFIAGVFAGPFIIWTLL